MQTALDQIRELHALYEAGLLSREEFDARKNAILDAAFAGSGGEAVLRAGTEIGLMAGQEIGPQNRRYRLERLIAHGGTGQVWQATDLATQAEVGHSAQVALKIVLQQFTQSAGHARLLVEEATRARRLAHEHIVRVYEWAQDPATASYFIIMEYLDGEDLDRLLAREGKLPLPRVAALLSPVAAALDYAWDKHRLVHRDLKPANVFVTTKGEVKLLDFGIAARSRANSPALEAPASSGTAGYRAPEAADPRLAPSRALDVYAVAVMIYLMLAGRLPFDGLAIAAAPAQPAGLADAAWEVLRAGLAADPALRPPSASALLARVQAGAAAPAAAVAAPEAPAAPEPQPGEPQPVEPHQPPPLTDTEAKALAEARVKLARQRREQEKTERAATEGARRARKEQLREQLRARRTEELDKARLAQTEAQRKALHDKAVAAYEAEQKRVHIEPAPAPEPASIQPQEPQPQALAAGVLSDRFIDGSASAPQLVVIPTGRFQMGSPDHERQVAQAAGTQAAWLAREQPRRWVGIERPFAMGRYPVTLAQWRYFVRATGWQLHSEIDWAGPGFAQGDEHPVVGVTWGDAQRYVAWLSERTGQRYRLPSEAEWEYACRAGSKTPFSFGDTVTPDQANYDASFAYDGGACCEPRRATTPVSQFAPNRWGLHDMHGNVWEWVQDSMHDSYVGAPPDGSAWEHGGDGARRVLRGGSWSNHPRYLRSALRNGFSAALANDIVGFRVVRELA